MSTSKFLPCAAEINVRCSAIVFREDAVLLVHRLRDGADDWVLPGGTPRPSESMAACARRETLEETGLAIDPSRVAFVLEALGPEDHRRTVDLVFLATGDVRGEPDAGEPDLEARFVPLVLLPGLDVRPPLSGHLRSSARVLGRVSPGPFWLPVGEPGDRA